MKEIPSRAIFPLCALKHLETKEIVKGAKSKPEKKLAEIFSYFDWIGLAR